MSTYSINLFWADISLFHLDILSYVIYGMIAKERKGLQDLFALCSPTQLEA